MTNHITNDVLLTLKRIVHGARREMRIDLYAILLVAGSAFGLALQTPDLQAADQAIVKLGGLQSRVPGDWKEEVPYDPRGYKAYRLEPASNDQFDANVTIYSLGNQPEDMAHATSDYGSKNSCRPRVPPWPGQASSRCSN